MTQQIQILCITAASLGFIHTVLGPDHYLPFVMMAKSGKWSLFKTTTITILCGIGHVLSSVVLGFLGIALGIAVTSLESVESLRGEIAAWALIAFGLVYFVWGMRRAAKKNGGHGHIHLGGKKYHLHSHEGEPEGKTNMTPWILFVVFVLGPCEPLIPLLMYPAAKSDIGGVFLVALVFGSITIATMTTIVLLLRAGLLALPLKPLERYIHAIAGAVILMCGISIRFLGL